MKKAIIALSILCTGALVINPISFAQNKTNDTHQEISQNLNQEETNKVTSNNTLNEEEKSDKIQNAEDKKTEDKKINAQAKEDNSFITEKEDTEKESSTIINNKEENNYDDIKENTVENKENSEAKDEVNNKLTQEQAKELLKLNNPSVDFIYQGDANNFDVLKTKGLSGYVYLPNVEGDMGYFVDDSTGDIYYFHPSGYLELVK